jgi:hypothetical protein
MRGDFNFPLRFVEQITSSSADGLEAADQSLIQERRETCLFKMLVGSQGFGQSAFAHQDERNAVGSTPIFVGPVTKQVPAAGNEFLGQRNNFYPR